MAEVVFQNLEGMLPELEDLERKNVFTKEELKTIVKRRTDFEYKLQKRVTCKEDILNYLEYELKLHILMKRRSTRLKLKPHSTATTSITKRIHKLFRKALMRFGDDLKLWVQYIDFCKKTDATRAISIAFGNLLQKHCNNPDAWIFAAKYELEDSNNVENARSLLQRALRQNKTSKKLWIEYFRLELLHVDKLKQRRKVLGAGGIDISEGKKSEPKNIDQFLSNKTAEIVYGNAIKHFQDDLEMRLNFLDVVRRFEGTENVQDFIYSSLSSDFEESEEILEVLSKRAIMDLKINAEENLIQDEKWKATELKVFEEFKQAIDKLNTSSMWEKFLNCFGELLQDSQSSQQAQRRIEYIKSIVDDAEKAKRTSESMYLFWFEIFNDDDETDPGKLLPFISNALLQHPSSLELWQKYLTVNAQVFDSWEELQLEFRSALTALQKEGNLLIWQMYVDVAQELDYEIGKSVYEEAMDSPAKEVKELFLPQYFSWIYEKQGIKACRKFYKTLSSTRLSLDFLYKCLAVEEAQEKDNTCIVHMRQIHEKIIDSYGDNDTDVWLAYLNFERTYNVTDMRRYGTIYNRAKKTLQGGLNAEFITKYTLLKNS